MIGGFDLFVGIDWSGAAGRSHKGIAVAECDRDGRCRIVPSPSGRRWSRAAVLSHLVALPLRSLVGIDCAFSLPWPDEGPLPAGIPQPATADELWQAIDAVCAGADDLYGGPAYRPEGGWLAPYLFTALTKAPVWSGDAFRPDRLRRTEMRLRPAPNSVFKIVGAKTVGAGSFAGMRLLAALRASRSDLAIWPFDPLPSDGGLTVIEIYPSAYYARAGHRGSRKSADLDRVLASFGATVAGDRPRPGSDEADALVAAAALRSLASAPDAFAIPPDPAVRREGWIFGVPA